MSKGREHQNWISLPSNKQCYGGKITTFGLQFGFKYLNRHFLDVWEINLPELFSVIAKSSGDNVCKISKTMFLEKQFYDFLRKHY